MTVRDITILTHARLIEALDYNPQTGIFVWKISSGKAKPGKVAGCAGKGGYRHITIDKEPHVAGRIAFFYVHGRWPINEIDHRNRIVDDDRIDNLREATNLQNLRNRGVLRNNKSGFKGVFWWKYRNCWRAVIMVNFKQKVVGHFKTAEAAARGYDKAARELFGEFAFFNFPQEQT